MGRWIYEYVRVRLDEVVSDEVYLPASTIRRCEDRIIRESFNKFYMGASYPKGGNGWSWTVCVKREYLEWLKNVKACELEGVGFTEHELMELFREV